MEDKIIILPTFIYAVMEVELYYRFWIERKIYLKLNYKANNIVVINKILEYFAFHILFIERGQTFTNDG